MRLILIRHGQTPSNVRNLLDTAVPGPGLTALGHRQAGAIPAAISRLDGTQQLTAIYVSNQTRAQLTAAPLAAAVGLKPQIRAGLREIDAGELEMHGDVESVGKYLEVVRSWISGGREARIPGTAQTGVETLARFDAVVREAEQAAAPDSAGGGDPAGRTVVVVSHGAMIRTWAGCRASNIDPAHPENYSLSNTGIVVLEGSTAEGAPSELRDGERTESEPWNAERTWSIVSWQSQPAGGSELADTSADGPTDDADGPRDDADASSEGTDAPADGFSDLVQPQARHR